MTTSCIVSLLPLVMNLLYILYLMYLTSCNSCIVPLVHLVPLVPLVLFREWMQLMLMVHLLRLTLSTLVAKSCPCIHSLWTPLNHVHAVHVILLVLECVCLTTKFYLEAYYLLLFLVKKLPRNYIEHIELHCTSCTSD